MNEPNALRLAKWLDAMPSSGYALSNQAAAELRRLHKVNQELLDVLQSYSLPIDMNNIAKSCSEFGCKAVELELNRRAAIAKAEVEQK